jgi:protein TonB
MKKIFLLFTALFISSLLFAQHTIVLKNGKTMTGRVKSLVNGTVELENNQTISTVKVSEISVIKFSEDGNQSSSSSSRDEVGEKEFLTGESFVKYKVADRNMVKPPRIDNMTQKKGTVVVAVSINKYGNVIKATPGAAGSSTTDEYLLTKARQAAESAIFDKVPTAPLEQTGYIVINF